MTGEAALSVRCCEAATGGGTVVPQSAPVSEEEEEPQPVVEATQTPVVDETEPTASELATTNALLARDGTEAFLAMMPPKVMTKDPRVKVDRDRTPARPEASKLSQAATRLLDVIHQCRARPICKTLGHDRKGRRQAPKGTSEVPETPRGGLQGRRRQKSALAGSEFDHATTPEGADRGPESGVGGGGGAGGDR